MYKQGHIFYLVVLSSGQGLLGKSGATPCNLPFHLFGNAPSLLHAEAARGENSVTLCLCEEHWQVAEGWSHFGDSSELQGTGQVTGLWEPPILPVSREAIFSAS